MERKVDLLFTRQRSEYGCCECGRFDDDTKQLYDGSFKMAKVLKDSLYRAAPSSILSIYSCRLFVVWQVKICNCDIVPYPLCL